MVIKCLEASVARALQAWAERYNIKIEVRDEPEGDKRIIIEHGQQGVTIFYSIEESVLTIFKKDVADSFIITSECYWEVTLT